ncbi:MAG TPA: glycogen-binding domain-containing protein [Gemmatimonadaceae bacterium]|nr:glycogen-binding domain-containing protein [Gemmatimonadaceae bacterium]
MRTLRPLVIGMALAGFAPNESSAQVRPQNERLHDVSVDVGGIALRRRDEPWRSAVSVVPHWRTATSEGAFYVGGAVSGTQNGYEAAYGTLGLELTPQTSRSRAWDLAGTATVLSARATQAIGVASLRGRKHWMADDQGAWLGVTLGGRTQDQTQFGSLAAEASFWRSVAPATTLMFTASATQAGDFLYYEYSDAPEAEFRLPHTARFGELAAALRHVDRRVELSMDARYRIGSSEVLGGSGAFSGDVALWLTSRYALVGLVGRQLADPALGTASTVYASIGLRIAARSAGSRAHMTAPREPIPTRRSEIVFARDGRGGATTPMSEMGFADARGGVFVELRAPPTANTVEIAGDFTDWQPVALERHNGVWRLPSVLPFGVYRIIIRIDGAEWRPPVGLPRLHDEFGGEVGVVTVR